MTGAVTDTATEPTTDRLTVRELDAPPNLALLYAKAAVSGLTGRPAGDGGLPGLELVVGDITVDRERLAAYNRVCGFRLRDRLPVTYPHLLAFPLAVSIMAKRSFPFALPGLVHIANRITHHRPIDASESLDVHVRTQDLRAHPKGRQFDVAAEATVAGQPVWSSTSTYLHRGPGGERDADKPGPDSNLAVDVADPGTRWRVAADIGRRYGTVSGDRNPIHLHPLTARAFGFPRQIAHGMWTKARCLAGLEGRLPERFEVDVAFKKPVVLPATVAFTSRRDGGRWTFALHDAAGQRPHLQGLLETR